MVFTVYYYNIKSRRSYNTSNLLSVGKVFVPKEKKEDKFLT